MHVLFIEVHNGHSAIKFVYIIKIYLCFCFSSTFNVFFYHRVKVTDKTIYLRRFSFNLIDRKTTFGINALIKTDYQIWLGQKVTLLVPELLIIASWANSSMRINIYYQTVISSLLKRTRVQKKLMPFRTTIFA